MILKILAVFNSLCSCVPDFNSHGKNLGKAFQHALLIAYIAPVTLSQTARYEEFETYQSVDQGMGERCFQVCANASPFFTYFIDIRARQSETAFLRLGIALTALVAHARGR